jgi:photosystem II stability/assembly factor-like uncharacterized protein
MTTVLVATAEGVHRVTVARDGCVTESTLAGDVRCLAVDPRDRWQVWAGTQGDGVWRTHDGGRAWRPSGPAGAIVKSIAVDPTAGAVYAGTKPPRVLRSGDGGLTWTALAAFPRRRSWFWRQPAERPSTPYVQSLAVCPADPRLIVAGIEAGAVVRTADGGTTWSGHLPGAGRDCHVLAFAGPDTIVEASGTGACRVSDDRGGTWHTLRTGIDGGYGWRLALGDTGTPRFLIAARTRTAHRSDAGAGVYRAAPDGSWRRVLGPLTRLPQITIDPAGGVWLAAAGELHHSTDNGDTWARHEAPIGWPRAIVAVG